MVFLHAHLQVVYYICLKLHKNPISRLGGVAVTRYMDGRTDWWTDGQGDSYISPQTLFAGGIKKCLLNIYPFFFCIILLSWQYHIVSFWLYKSERNFKIYKYLWHHFQIISNSHLKGIFNVNSVLDLITVTEILNHIKFPFIKYIFC